MLIRYLESGVDITQSNAISVVVSVTYISIYFAFCGMRKLCRLVMVTDVLGAYLYDITKLQHNIL
jgi:hypothetical protein